MNRHRHEAIAIAFMELGRQSAGFAAEDEHGVVARTEGGVPQDARRFRREKERLAERRQLSLERAPAWPHARVDVLPVVESRAFHFALVERKTERLDEMQMRARGETGAAGVAGVPVDFGVYEDDVDGQERKGRGKALRTEASPREMAA